MHDPKCPECVGSGLRDSGGTQPWGEPILLTCDCDKPQADFACEDCMGTAEHGCYCAAIGAIAPGILP
jgi:hypothetical protein